MLKGEKNGGVYIFVFHKAVFAQLLIIFAYMVPSLENRIWDWKLIPVHKSWESIKTIESIIPLTVKLCCWVSMESKLWISQQGYKLNILDISTCFCWECSYFIQQITQFPFAINNYMTLENRNIFYFLPR